MELRPEDISKFLSGDLDKIRLRNRLFPPAVKKTEVKDLWEVLQKKDNKSQAASSNHRRSCSKSPKIRESHRSHPDFKDSVSSRSSSNGSEYSLNYPQKRENCRDLTRLWCQKASLKIKKR